MKAQTSLTAISHIFEEVKAMKKRLWMSLCMVAALGQAHASASGVEYNIAKGLSPQVKDQSISVLQPFYGNFRILGSKV